MANLKERVTEAMLRNPQLRKADVARACKIKPPSVAGWFSGKTRELSADTAKAAADLFGCDAFWLATGHGTPKWKDDQEKSQPNESCDPCVQIAVEDALKALGTALAQDMPNDISDDIADTLSKLAKRRGSDRDQQMVIHLLNTVNKNDIFTKDKRAA